MPAFDLVVDPAADPAVAMPDKLRECPACALDGPADAKECPYCGYEYPGGPGRTAIVVALVMAALLAWPLIELVGILF